jgi:glycosyltransferase involved in cell wall biosynthesis
MEYILDLLYFYAATYTLYFLALSLRNLGGRRFMVERKLAHAHSNAAPESKDSIAIIIYAHNSKATLGNLIREIKAQDYPINHIKVFVILDNCIDNSEELFANENFIRVINIKEVGTVGKDKAISVLLERLTRDQSIDSYVFIDGDRNIPVDFLSIINTVLLRHSVASGETLMMTETLGPVDKIKAAYQKYHMNFMRRARSLFGLASQADSGVFAMKKEIADQLEFVDFKDINSELKYSMLLSEIGHSCFYNPNIQTFVDTVNYEFKKPRLSVRLNLFRRNFARIWKSGNPVFAEHVISMLYPNIWLLMFIYLVVLKHSYNYYFIVDFKIVLFTFLLLVLGFGLSLIKSKLTARETWLLMLYPLYSLAHIIKHLPPIRAIRNKLMDNEDAGAEKLAVDVVVMSNSRELPCRLEFISESGLARVRFIFKDKRYTTSSHIRMIDALHELKVKLYEYGFILKICNCCSSFRSDMDGSTNMLKGVCTCNYPSPMINDTKQTLIWNSCTRFNPAPLATGSFIEELSEE